MTADDYIDQNPDVTKSALTERPRAGENPPSLVGCTDASTGRSVSADPIADWIHAMAVRYEALERQLVALKEQLRP